MNFKKQKALKTSKKWEDFTDRVRQMTQYLISHYEAVTEEKKEAEKTILLLKKQKEELIREVSKLK